MDDAERAISPVDVFYSYAIEDEHLCKELEKHLSVLKRQKLIVSWYKRSISAGADWAKEIDTHLNSSGLILLLVSANFMASDYCYGIEMARALQRHIQGEAQVIPIIVRTVLWKNAPFADLQVLPTDGIPITSSRWRTRDEAWTNVAEGIRKAILAPADLHTPLPQVVWNLPYARNPFFTGRERLLAYLHDQFVPGREKAIPHIQALSGLSGIGKTQIAIEYAYRFRYEYSYILWVRAETRDLLTFSFEDLARLLALPVRQEQDEIIAEVKQWLTIHDKWLLIFDEANDLAMVSDFLPQRNNGSILLTTCAHAFGNIGHVIEVEPLDPQESILLLLQRASFIPTPSTLDEVTPENKAEAAAIVRALGGLPLAIDQAAAYIQETGCGLSRYLTLFQQHGKELLRRRGGFSYDHPESVARTWLLSLQQIEQRNLVAADLLRICAFLDPDAIPEELLTEAASEFSSLLQPITVETFGLYEGIDDLLPQSDIVQKEIGDAFNLRLVPQPVAPDAFKLDEAIAVLRSFSLVRRVPDLGILTMHRLVQATIKDAMDSEVGKLWAERAVRAVNTAFPAVMFATWPRCRRCLPHALSCVNHIDQYKLIIPEAAPLLTRTGWYLRELAQYAQAEVLFHRALNLYEKTLGPEDSDVGITLNNLALLYRAQGRYGEAEPLFRRALALDEKHHGPDHQETASTLDNLAGLYRDQKRYDEAEILSQRALAIREKTIGSSHSYTAASLNNLSRLYYAQKRYTEAETWLLRALAIREKAAEHDHPDTATTLSNLAQLYQVQGRYAEAESLFLRALAIREAALDPGHPSIIATLESYATLLQKLNRTKEAAELKDRANTARQQRL